MKSLDRRTFLKASAAAGLTLGFPSLAWSAEFPSRPMQVYIPTRAGGGLNYTLQGLLPGFGGKGGDLTLGGKVLRTRRILSDHTNIYGFARYVGWPSRAGTRGRSSGSRRRSTF